MGTVVNQEGYDLVRNLLVFAFPVLEALKASTELLNILLSVK